MRRVEFTLVAVLCLSFAASKLTAADKDFTAKAIDIGMVVSDVKKAAAFYTDVVGMTEAMGFSVPGEYCKEVGLTTGKGIDVRVFKCGEGENAASLKLMEIPGVDSKKSDNANIHAQLGFRYLTIHVADTNATMERIKKAGIKTVGATPKTLPPGHPQDLFLTIVRDPDGNLVELIGPKK